MLRSLLAYLLYNLIEKWRFVYFEIGIEEIPSSLPNMRESFVIRIAEEADIHRIESDVYPFITSDQEYDKRYISRIGGDGFKCFIAEKDDLIIHYFLVFERALESPLMCTPFYKEKILDNDAYLGSAFTTPNVRGLWIMPCVLREILSFLKDNTKATRALVLVHEGTLGAVGFFSRLGFSRIDDACPAGSIASLVKNIFSLWK